MVDRTFYLGIWTRWSNWAANINVLLMWSYILIIFSGVGRIMLENIVKKQIHAMNYVWTMELVLYMTPIHHPELSVFVL